MLNRRYQNDSKPTAPLNELQLKCKRIVDEKVNSNKYVFEDVNCVVCASNDFELLAQKERYGLYMPVVICKNCGLVQTNPRMDKKSYNDFYDGEYRQLNCGTETATDEFFKVQFNHGRAIYNYIESVIKEPIKNKFIVEVGTGAGGNLDYFKRKGNKVFGIDLGSEYIKFGRNKGLDLAVGTVKELSKIDQKPDIVIYSHVFEHLLGPIEELKILKKFLKPDSLVFIEVPGIKDLYNSYNQDFLKYLTNAHTYHFTLNSLLNCTKKAGLKLVSGNETITSLFRVGEVDNKYNSDYRLTMAFLRALEKLRTNPFNKYRIKNRLFSFGMFILRVTNMSNVVRKAYYKNQSKRDKIVLKHPI